MNQSDQIATETLFPSVVYLIQAPQFIEDVSMAANDALQSIKAEIPQPNEYYPVYQTGPLFDDIRIHDFANYIVQTGWNILNSQGYDVYDVQTELHELWCQEHYKYSGMDEHIHGRGAQLIGFYFLETPDNCSKVVFHDPRPGKKQINLRENNIDDATIASDMINYTPKPGMLMFANSWLPHSFSKNASDKPIKFIHFTIGIKYVMQQPFCTSEAEVI